MLKSRTVHTALQGDEVEAKVSRRCLQEGVISSTQWTHVTDDQIRVSNDSGFYPKGYLNDRAILMIFNRRWTHLDLRKHQFCDRVVAFQKSEIYLEAIFDTELTLKLHVDSVLKKAKMVFLGLHSI